MNLIYNDNPISLVWVRDKYGFSFDLKAKGRGVTRKAIACYWNGTDGVYYQMGKKIADIYGPFVSEEYVRAHLEQVVSGNPSLLAKKVQ